MEYKLRLRDLDNISSEEVISLPFFEQIFGFKKTWILNKWRFNKLAPKVFDLMIKYREMDVSKLEYNEDCNIKRPQHIDFITFVAMMELISLLSSNQEDTSVQQKIAIAVATVSFSEMFDEDYSSKSEQYDLLIKQILNEPLEDMVGYYNWIVKSVEESQSEWQKRFLSVKVDNPTYDKAEKGRMSQFNIINTIKTICSDFNCSYDEAWQMSYNLTQTNSYSEATRARIQSEETKLREIEFQQKRRS